MKKIFMIILLLIALNIFLISNETKKPVKQIKEGEAAPYSGVLLSSEEYEKLYEAYRILEVTQPLDKNMKYQLFKYEELIKLKDQEIKFLQSKYDYEFQFRKEIQSRLDRKEIQVKILSVTTGIGVSIALAELLGIGVFAILNNSVNR